jgi:hypothetical protein
MFSDDNMARTSPVTLADCKVSREAPFIGNAREHFGFQGHEQEYHGFREARSFGGFGISLLRPDKTPLPLYRDKSGALWVASEDGESFAVELHVRGGDKTRDRWAALLRINGKQEHTVSTAPAAPADSVYLMVTQPQSKGHNIVRGWTQSSDAVQPFVFQSESHGELKGHEPQRYGVVNCTFYAEHHPQRFLSPVLRGPALSGYVVNPDGSGITDARSADFTVSRDFNQAVEIRFAPKAEIDRLGATPVEPVKPYVYGDPALSALRGPARRW